MRELRMILCCAVIAAGSVFGGAMFAVHELDRSFAQPAPAATALFASTPLTAQGPPGHGWRYVRSWVGHCFRPHVCMTCSLYVKHGRRRVVCGNGDAGW